MEEVIEKYKAFKALDPDSNEDDHCDNINEFIAELSRGDLYEFFEAVEKSNVTDIDKLSCNKCRRSLTPSYKDGECIICNKKL